MDKLGSSQMVLLLIQLGVMLMMGRIFAEIARFFKQPSVVGEIIVGILLGPTLMGMLAPDFFLWIFPTEGVSRIVLDGLVQLAVVVLLFIAGLEVDLHIVWQQGKQALLVSFFALVVPFLAGFGISFMAPGFFGVNQEDVLVFSLFMATIMGMTALPVIVRILMDLNLMKGRMGMLIVASAMIVDLLCWMIFSVILSMMGTNHQTHSITQTALMTFGFAALMLTVGRGLLNRVLPWINKSLAWPGGILSLSMSLCFLASALTEYIGIHAIFGAFIIGVVLGDSEHFSERAKEIVHQFINNIFAPLFFVSIGLYINVLVSFNFWVVAVVFLIAFLSKGIGATMGARFGGLSTVQSLAVGMGMNTHGTLEIILGTLALQAGLITEEVFVAILFTVLITIVISAPLIKYCLDLDKQSSQLKNIAFKIFREKQ
jgi:Kef-type K+ transport system membrane component KefB